MRQAPTLPNPCNIPGIHSACSAVGSVAKGAASDAVQSLADAMERAEAEMLRLLMSGWTKPHTPSVTSTGTTSLWLQQQLHWYVALAGVIGLLVAAGRMAWSHRVDPAVKAGSGVLRLVLISGAGTAGVAALVAAGDGFSNWVLNNAAHGDPAAKLTHGGALTQGAFASSGLVIVLGIVAILAFIVQLALLIIRSALIVVLAGVWPLSAAASITDVGESWYRKVTGWLLAFVLFKPAAAIVYAAAVRQLGTGKDALSVVTGIVLVAMATLTLPALMRFVVPMVATVGNVSGAAATAGAATAAMGAKSLAGGAGAGAAAAAASGAGGGGANGSGGGGNGSSPPNGASPMGGMLSPGGGRSGLSGKGGSTEGGSEGGGSSGPSPPGAGEDPSSGGSASGSEGDAAGGNGPSGATGGSMPSPGAIASGADRKAHELTGGAELAGEELADGAEE